MPHKPNDAVQTRQRHTASRISSYYEQSAVDYSFLWSRHHLHFGYWDENTTSHAASLLNMNRQVAARANLHWLDRVLDAGCGVGGFAVWMALHYGVDVHGVTIVPEQIARARQHALASGVAHAVSFHLRDYTATGFRAGSFQAVVAIESICHADDKRAFLREAYRLLVPGGRLVVCDGFRRRRTTGEDELLMRSWLDGWAVPDLTTSEEFTTWAREAGFQDVKLEDIERYVRPSHYRLHRMARLAYLPALALEKLGIRSAVQTGNVRAARDQWFALERDLWFQGIFSATKKLA
ncbi:MAG TPA: methyltransferase domain-containing protein [Candidatus Obscuribacterales bacterium]